MKSWSLLVGLALVLATVPGAAAGTQASDCDSIFDSCSWDCDVGPRACGVLYTVLAVGGALCALLPGDCPV